MQQADYSYNVGFDCTRVGIPNPHVVQGSTVVCEDDFVYMTISMRIISRERAKGKKDIYT